MESPEHEREAIEAYLAKEAPGEQVIHLEKVASERVLGRDRDVWDVHTDVERWWVITGPTFLYSQAQFPSMDVALSFHVGLTARVAGRQQSAKNTPAPFAEAWRKWEQADEALNTAHQAEDYQAVGMRCRESMIAFIRAASEIVSLPPGTVPPKGADVKNWAEVLGDLVAPGDQNKEWRCYLKALAAVSLERFRYSEAL